MPEIKKYIRAYGFDVGERAILSDIDALIFYGMDIEYVHNKGYHLKSRPFSLSILKMLADAIASFRFLTIEDSHFARTSEQYSYLTLINLVK